MNKMIVNEHHTPEVVVSVTLYKLFIAKAAQSIFVSSG